MAKISWTRWIQGQCEVAYYGTLTSFGLCVNLMLNEWGGRWNLPSKINVGRDSFFQKFLAKRKSYIYASSKQAVSGWALIFWGAQRVTGVDDTENEWVLPATEDNDRSVCGCQLLLQLSDHDGVVSEGLLHRQQADLRDVEGVLAKWPGFAVVPL